MTIKKRRSGFVFSSVFLVLAVVLAFRAHAEGVLGENELPVSVSTQVQTQIETWTTDLAKGDFSAWEQYWAEDAVLMPSEHDRVIGRSNILEFAKGFSLGTGFEFTEWSFAGSGDLVVVSNRIEIEDMKMANGKVSDAYFNQILVLRFLDGKWLFQTVIFNVTDATG